MHAQSQRSGMTSTVSVPYWYGRRRVSLIHHNSCKPSTSRNKSGASSSSCVYLLIDDELVAGIYVCALRPVRKIPCQGNGTHQCRFLMIKSALPLASCTPPMSLHSRNVKRDDHDGERVTRLRRNASASEREEGVVRR